jgi:hypothetical protein
MGQETGGKGGAERPGALQKKGGPGPPSFFRDWEGTQGQGTKVATPLPGSPGVYRVQ